jgi:predicted Rossmann-fold nucleotide-binding protein
LVPTGGGQVGLMGAVAKTVVEGGGKAKGIVPVPLYRNGSSQFTETAIVPDMHTRKRMMSEEVCQGFKVLILTKLHLLTCFSE